MPHSIYQCPVGQKQNFSYLISDQATKKAAVVDPAWEVKKILVLAQSKELEITDILLTHSHYDHVNGLGEILESCKAKVHLSEAEANFWKESQYFQMIKHQDNDIISLGDTKIQALHTSGHTIGSMCYYIEGNLITGDTLFIPRCGRCDLPSGNAEQMFYSLKRITETFSPQTMIYPGHNYGETPTATLAELMTNNSSLQFNECADFMAYLSSSNRL